MNHQYTRKSYNPFLRISVFISATKTGLKKRSQLGVALKEAMQRGVQVVVFVKNKTEEVEWLQREGLTVHVSEHLTFQLVMIDKKKIWYGSINYCRKKAFRF